MGYYGNGFILFPKNNKVGIDKGLFSCWPKIVNLNQSVTIRIVVLGEFYKDNHRTGIPVGAYVDVKISP
ncbi:MAG: hypothetical protein P4L50_12160 [Anaerolineaceae bacterium]|nr:hypothetical protein [Anaerolineaceae bacterium]